MEAKSPKALASLDWKDAVHSTLIPSRHLFSYDYLPLNTDHILKHLLIQFYSFLINCYSFSTLATGANGI